ncbi:MAG TPA: hypothetical protein PKA34_12965 [Blastocatellia bacterium]|nr:hypothetical protein [Blastocatellia bacterium]
MVIVPGVKVAGKELASASTTSWKTGWLPKPISVDVAEASARAVKVALTINKSARGKVLPLATANVTPRRPPAI